MGRKEKMKKEEFILLITWGVQIICGLLGGLVIVLMIRGVIGILTGIIILTKGVGMIIGGSVITYMLINKKADTSP